MKRLLILLSLSVFLLTACGDMPPTVPGDFIVNAVSSTQILLKWTESLNEEGIAHYEIWRDNKKRGISHTTGYLDKGLMNSTIYCYAVRAMDDGSDDASDFTETKCAETYPFNDSTAPTSPTGLLANAVSSSEIDLTWDESTDNVAVTGYTVYRDDVLLTTVTTTFMNDTSLSSVTSYCYTVEAYDQVGNTSIKSIQSCDTTDP